MPVRYFLSLYVLSVGNTSCPSRITHQIFFFLSSSDRLRNNSFRPASRFVRRKTRRKTVVRWTRLYPMRGNRKKNPFHSSQDAQSDVSTCRFYIIARVYFDRRWYFPFRIYRIFPLFLFMPCFNRFRNASLNVDYEMNYRLKPRLFFRTRSNPGG